MGLTMSEAIERYREALRAYGAALDEIKRRVAPWVKADNEAEAIERIVNEAFRAYGREAQ